MLDSNNDKPLGVQQPEKTPVTEHIIVNVTGKTEVFFKLKLSTSLTKLMAAFCERQNREHHEVRFLFNGASVQPDDTPQSLKMKDGDIIEACTDQISNDHKGSATSLPGNSGYQIPGWFLTHNVRTAAELIESHISHTPKFSNEKDDKGPIEGHISKYELDNELYSELRDTTTSALLWNRVSQEFYSQQPSILLQVPVPGAFNFLDSVVEQLAREVRASIVSVDLDDLVDVAFEFSRQDAEVPNETQSPYDLAEKFFVINSERAGSQLSFARKRQAVSTILDASKLKMESQRPSDQPLGQSLCENRPPVFLYVRDAKRIIALEKGGKILKTLRTIVQDHRKRNEPVILLATISLDTLASEELDWELTQLHKEILVDSTCIFNVAPPKTKRYEALFAAEDAQRIQDATLRQLKQILRHSLDDGFSSDLLAPGSQWNISKTNPFFGILKNSKQSEGILKRAAKQIIGRTWGKSALELEDINEVITRLGHTAHSDAISQWKNATEVSSSSFAEKLDNIKRSCNKYEKELCSCVIDPESIHVTFDDVIVGDEVKDTVKQLISLSNFRPCRASHILLREIRITGALLYGPPGTGKTHLSRAIAKDSGVSMLAVSPAGTKSMWVGETEKYITAMFSLAKKLAPCILFIDEGDALFQSRSSWDRGYERSATNQFLQEMDGLATTKDSPFVLVSTNRPTDLDQAFLRRLPQKIFFPLPSEVDRGRILKTMLKEQDLQLPLTTEVLAKATPGFSGSDLGSLCGQAALIFATEQLRAQPTCHAAGSSNRLKLDARHFAKALERTRPSVSEATVEEFDKFAMMFNPRIFNPQATGVPPWHNLLSGIMSSTPNDHPNGAQQAREESSALSREYAAHTALSSIAGSSNKQGSSEIPSFQYEPLNTESQDIRLIKASPTQPRFVGGGEISVAMHTVSLKKNPPFVALSYAWGEPQLVHPITCNQQRVMVTKNLAQVLSTVFALVKSTTLPYYAEGEEIFLWVDGICINQDDKDEKAVQISLMKDIYAGARCVVAYVGAPESGDPNSALVSFAFKSMDAPPRSADPFVHSRARDAFGAPSSRGTGELIRAEINASSQQLLLQPWFARGWVFQEMVLASDVLCIYGDETNFAHWRLDELMDVLAKPPSHSWLRMIDHGNPALYSRRDSIRRDGILLPLTRNALNIEAWRLLRSKIRNSPDGLDPIHLLSKGRRAFTGDPRDKVYSMAGLFPTSFRNLLKVDYSPSNTASRTFIDFAESCIRFGSGIQLLEQGGTSQRIPELPSWVPDWSFEPRYPLDYPLYHCAGSTEASVSLSSEPGKIRAHGWSIGSVIDVGWPTSYSEEVLVPSHPHLIKDGVQLILANEEMAYYMCSAMADSDGRIRGEHRSDVVWRTLSADRSTAGCRADASNRRHYDAWLGKGRKFLDMRTEQSPTDAATPNMEDNSTGNITEFIAAAMSVSGRVLGLISGGFLGLLPNDAELGDVIVVLLGGRMPFLFRSIKGTEEFRVVGPCYLHGAMDGEFVDESGEVPRSATGEEFKEFVIG